MILYISARRAVLRTDGLDPLAELDIASVYGASSYIYVLDCLFAGWVRSDTAHSRFGRMTEYRQMARVRCRLE